MNKCCECVNEEICKEHRGSHRYCFDPKEDIQTSECQERLMKYALDLITCQKAEIERLKKDKYKLQKALNQSEDYRVIAKSEAIKEFAEKLKEKSFETIRNYGLTKDVVEVCDIDNLVKEIIEENK